MSPAESTLQFICDAYVCFCMHMYLSHLKVSYILLIITCAEKKNQPNKQNPGNYFFFCERTMKISSIFREFTMATSKSLVYGMNILQK